MADEDEWVQIINPDTGSIGEVNRSSLYQHYQAGWRLLAPDEIPEPEPDTEPAPMTRAEAAQAARQADSTESEDQAHAPDAA